jgi:hypothetical protein
MISEFKQSVIEKVETYVYILIDPRNNKIFYVGKGKGNRIFQHVKGGLKEETRNGEESLKTSLIKEIIKSGHEVKHFIVRHGLTDEVALEIESAIIDLLSNEYLKLSDLTNEVKGHDSWERGMTTADELNLRYSAEPVDIKEPAIIFTINQLYNENMTAEELYNATHCCWNVGVDREKAKYAIAAYAGLVREVYEIEKWQPSKVEGRWEFTGKIADDEIRKRYLYKSLEKYIKKGAQNPIRYTF